jgi:hypothetical protein
VTSGIESYEVEVETKDDFGLDAKIATVPVVWTGSGEE